MKKNDVPERKWYIQRLAMPGKGRRGDRKGRRGFRASRKYEVKFQTAISKTKRLELNPQYVTLKCVCSIDWDMFQGCMTTYKEIMGHGQHVDSMDNRSWLETIGFHTKRFITKAGRPRYRNKLNYYVLLGLTFSFN